MKKGDICEGTVIRTDYPDKGIVITDEGETVTVKFGLPGDRIRFRVKKKRHSQAEGILLEVLSGPSCRKTEGSAEEKEGICEQFGICGGCSCQCLPYEEQLEMKKEQIRRLLDSTGADYEFEGIEASPLTAGYRNKMELTFGDSFKDGPLMLGMHRRGSFFDIVSVSECCMMHPDMRKISSCIVDFYRERKVPYMHRMTHEGVLRHLLLRRSNSSGEVMAALVTTTQYQKEEILALNDLLKELLALPLEGKLSGFLHILNDSQADIVQSDETRILYGKPDITEKLFSLNFRITPFSFFQTNSKGAEVLYGTVRDYIGNTKDRLVYDLYSGTGTIAQVLAPVAGEVVGVEIVEEAVEAARENAAQNGLSNCSFIAGDVLKVLDDLTRKPDLIVLDPPRDGIHPKALPKILDYNVERIVYVSCKPTSFVRDYAMFQERGYRMVKARAVDMFPGTANVETVVLLSGEKVDGHIDIDLDVEKLEGKSGTATYAEIKAYIKEKYGFNVTNLYIGQIKDKAGIKDRKNYNTGSGKEKVPTCPTDKEEAIMDAFKHFELI